MHGLITYGIAIVQNFGVKMTSKTVEQILFEWYPDGDFTEEDLWDAIAEANDLDVNEIMDQDILEFI